MLTTDPFFPQHIFSLLVQASLDLKKYESLFILDLKILSGLQLLLQQLFLI